MKNRTEEEILADLLRVTGATIVKPTAEEEADVSALEEQRRRSKIDSERSLAINRERKKEQEILRLARGEIVEARS